MKQQSGYAFVMILALIVSLGNLNTILMSVMERREFGMMMALGMKPIQIMLTVIFEAIATDDWRYIWIAFKQLRIFTFSRWELIWGPHTKVLTLPIPYSIYY